MSTEETVLVEALVEIEHDREKHYPGTKSAQFMVRASAVESLVRSGAVKQAAVVDADALLATDTTVATATAGADQVVTFADVGDQLELERLRAEQAAQAEKLLQAETAYTEAHAARVELGEQLAATQAQLAETQAALADAQAALEASATSSDAPAAAADGSAGADAGTGDADVVDATKVTTKASKATKA